MASGERARAMEQRANVTMVQKGQTGYRSPGKVVGKGLNYWGEDEYMAAWGNETEYQYGNEDLNCGCGDMSHVGNRMMLLEHNTTTRQDNEHIDKSHITTIIDQPITVAGSYDPLKKSGDPTPISVHNK